MTVVLSLFLNLKLVSKTNPQILETKIKISRF